MSKLDRDEMLTLLSSVVEQSNEGVAVADLKGNLIFTNRAYANAHGYEPEEIMDENLSIFHHPEHMPAVEAANEQIKETGEFNGEIWHARRDGSSFPTWMHNTLLKDEKGEPMGLIGTLRDISEHKQMEASLVAEVQKAQQYLDIAGVMMVAIDVEQRVTLINQKGCEILGYPEDQIIGQNWFDRFLPEDKREMVKGVFERIISGELEPVEYFENEVVDREGERRLLAWHNTMIREADGNIIGTLSSGEDITERTQAQAAAEILAQNWQTTFDAIDDSISLIDLDSRIMRCSQATERILNRTSKEIIGKPCYELVHGTDQPYDNCPMVRMKASHQRETMEFETEGRWLEVTVDPIFDVKGELTSAVHIIRDITERKESERALEESEASFRDIFDAATDMIGLQDIDTRQFVYINKETERVLGKTLQQMNEMRVESFSALGQDYSIERAGEHMQKALEGEPQLFEWGFIDKDEMFHPTEVSLKLVTVLGKDRLLSIARDITERKEAEEALRESEERFRNIYENSVLGIYRTSQDGTIMMANPALLNMLGYRTLEELKTRDLEAEGYHPEYPRSEFKKAIEEEGQVIGLESAWNRKDGSTLFVRENATAAHDDAGKMLYYEGTVEDITERQKVMAALKESELNYRAIVEDQTEMICRFKPDHTLTFVNESYARHWEKTPAEMVGLNFLTLIPEQTQAQVREHFRSFDPENFVETHEHEVIGKDGEPRWHRWTNRAFFDEEGQLVEFQSVGQDITERKLADQVIEESEAKFASAFHASPSLKTITRLADGLIVDANESFIGFSEYSRDELIGSKTTDLDIWARPEDRERVMRIVGEKGRVNNQEIEFKTRSGEITTHLFSAEVVNLNDEPHLISVSNDITQRKEAERSLSESEEKLRLLFDSSNDLITLADANANPLWANPAWEAIFGPLSEYVSQPFDLIHPEDLERVGKAWRNMVKKRQSIDNLEYRFKSPDQRYVHVETSAHPVLLGGKWQYYIIARNITERKRAEEELAIFRRFAEASSLAYGFADLEGDIAYVNPALAKIMGHEDTSQALGTKVSDYYPRELVGKLQEEILPCVLKEGSWDGELPLISISGKVTETLQNITLIRDEAGQPLYFGNIITDITERKQTEEVLRASEENYRTIYESVNDAIMIHEASTGRTLDVNPTMEAILGFSKAELLKLKISDWTEGDPAQIEQEAQFRLSEAAQGRVQILDWHIRRKDGTYLWAEVSLKNALIRGQECVMALVRDITDRKRAEQALQESEERYRTLAENAMDAIYLISPEEGFQYVNPAFQDLLGYTMEEVAGEDFDFMELVHAEDRKLIEERTRSRLEGQKVPPVYEFRIVTREGMTRTVEASTVQLSGQDMVIQGQLKDITMRREAEDDLQRAFELTKQREREVTALLTSSRAVMESHDFETAARAIFDTCTGLIGAVSGYVALLSADGEENEVLFLEAGGLPCDVDPALPMLIRGLRAQAYQSGKVVFDNNFNNSDWMKLMPAGHVTLENVLMVPLMVRGKAIGLMGMANKPGGFNEYDTRLAEAFGELAAIALRNTRDEEALRDSEMKLRTVIDHSSEVYYIHGLDHKLTYVSEGSQEVFGFTPQEMLVEWTTLVTDHPMNREGYKLTEKAIRTGRRQMPYLLEVRRKEGRNILVEIDESPIMDASGKVIGMSGALRDVTERENAHHALEESESLMRTIAENFPNSYISIIEEDMTVGFSSGQEFKNAGLRAEDFMGLSLEAVFGERYPLIREHYRRTFEGEPQEFELFVNKQYQLYRTVPLPDAGGGIKRILAVVENISERKQAELALQESLQTSDNIVKSSPIGLFIYHYQEPDTLILADGNEAASRLMGLEVREWFGREFDEVWPQARKIGFTDALLEVMRTGKMYDTESLEYQDERLTGLLHVRAFPIPGPRLVVALEDITERKQAEEALKESEARFRALFETSPDAVLIDQRGILLYANPAYQRIFGIHDLESRIGKPCDPIVAPEDRERVKDISAAREAGEPAPVTYEFTGQRKDGTRFPVEVTTARFNYHDEPAIMALIRDITERRELEQKVIQHERLAVIGQLAAGVAHEINTPLSNISLMADNLREETSDPVARDYADKTLGQVDFAAQIVRELLQFARPGIADMESIDLNRVVMAGLEQFPIPDWVKVETHLAPGPLSVRGDRFQLQEVVTNLLSNAIDALGPADEEGEGRVIVETRRTREGVRLTLTDDGCGIPGANQARLFEPFYTTKPTGRGTGLGLALVQRYLDAHAAIINISSAVDEGTVVTVDLLLSDDARARTATQAHANSNADAPTDALEGAKTHEERRDKEAGR